MNVLAKKVYMNAPHIYFCYKALNLLLRRYGTELKMRNDDCNESSSCPSQFKSLYIANLDPRVSEGILIQIVSGFGNITRSILAKDYRGESRGFAFVEFESTHSAEQAVEHMNGRLIGKHNWGNSIALFLVLRFNIY